MSKTEKIILLVLAAAVLACCALVVFKPEAPAAPPVVGEFVPPEFDSAAVAGTPEVGLPQMYGTLALNEDIAVSLYSAPIVSDGRAQVFFTSAKDNTAWVRLRIMDETGAVLGETGLLKPGQHVEYISLAATPKSARAIAKILTYEPETYYSLGSATAEIMLQIK